MLSGAEQPRDALHPCSSSLDGWEQGLGPMHRQRRRWPLLWRWHHLWLGWRVVVEVVVVLEEKVLGREMRELWMFR